MLAERLDEWKEELLAFVEKNGGLGQPFLLRMRAEWGTSGYA